MRPDLMLPPVHTFIWCVRYVVAFVFVCCLPAFALAQTADPNAAGAIEAPQQQVEIAPVAPDTAIADRITDTRRQSH